METWITKIIYGLFMVATTIIRYPFAKANKANQTVTQKKTPLEKFLMMGVWLGMMVLPLLYIISPLLSFAEYASNIVIQLIGLVLLPFVLWLFYRSHKDLGRNWSASLEIRKEHTLVDWGVYKHIRHPMYTAIWLWVICQAMILPNWIAGFSGMLSFGLLYFLRVDKEEQMMLEQFGSEYESYCKRTKRLMPYIW